MLQEGSSQQARLPGEGGRNTGGISTWDVSPQLWSREGQESDEDTGQAAPPPSHPELSTDIHTFTPQKVGGAQHSPCS